MEMYPVVSAVPTVLSKFLSEASALSTIFTTPARICVFSVKVKRRKFSTETSDVIGSIKRHYDSKVSTVYRGFVGSVALVVEQRTSTALAFCVGTCWQAGRKVTKSITCTQSYCLTFRVLELCARIRVDKPKT
jgi:hypothetical protein